MPKKTVASRSATPEEYSILTYCEQFFLTNGHLPNTGDIVAAGFDKKLFHGCLKLPQFQRMLEARGITPYTSLNAQGQVPVNLTPEQLECANTILDLADNRSHKKKLTDLNISTTTYQSWLRNPAFNKYLKQRAENLLKDNSHVSHMALLDRVTSGDISAIKYYNEITGRYIPSANLKGVDVHEILFKVLEIIQELVPNPEVQAAIAERLMTLGDPVVAKFEGVPVLAGQFKETKELGRAPVNSDSSNPGNSSASELVNSPGVIDVPVGFNPMDERPTVYEKLLF